MALEVREVDAADTTAVVSLVREVLAEFGITFGVGAGTDDQLRSLPRSYTDAGGVFFVALLDGRLVGTAGMYPKDPHVFELRKMYLRPEARGHGVGAALWARCLDFARARNARHVVLDTTEQMTAAIRFYEKAGFVRDDRQVSAPRCTRGYRLDLEPNQR